MVALITGWAILGFHRVIAWEWPVLGGRFILIRLLASGLLPILAGVLAQWLLPFFPHALVKTLIGWHAWHGSGMVRATWMARWTDLP